MPQYVITAQYDATEWSVGDVLSVEDAPNPEEALHEWAKRMVDEEAHRRVDDELELDTRIDLALWLVDRFVGEDADVSLFPVGSDAVGEPLEIPVETLGYGDDPFIVDR